MLFIFLRLRRGLLRLAMGGLSLAIVSVMHWHNTAVGIISETNIASGVASPIRMVSFPSVETLQPDWITGQPNITGSQVKIRAANDTDEFDTVPDVAVRNLDYRWRDLNGWRWRSHDHWCRSRNYQWLKSHCSIWINYTT